MLNSLKFRHLTYVTTLKANNFNTVTRISDRLGPINYSPSSSNYFMYSKKDAQQKKCPRYGSTFKSPAIEAESRLLDALGTSLRCKVTGFRLASRLVMCESPFPNLESNRTESQKFTSNRIES